MKMLKTLVAVIAFSVAMPVLAVTESDSWTYLDGATEGFISVRSKNKVDGNYATLSMGKTELGKYAYVYQPGKQPKSCVGQNTGHKMLDSSVNYGVMTYMSCNKDYKYPVTYRITGVEVSSLTDTFLEGKAVKIDGYTFSAANFETAASKL